MAPMGAWPQSFPRCAMFSTAVRAPTRLSSIRTSGYSRLSMDSPSNLLHAAAEQYRASLWRDQTYRPEVWIEKSALVGVIEPVCTRWRVPHFAARGYASISELYL